MGEPASRLVPGQPVRPRRLGVVVHPTRDLDAPLAAVTAWARGIDCEVAQIPFGGDTRRLSLPQIERAQECDLVVAIGGDGTTLAAIRTAAQAQRPVLGVACGSLGALTSVQESDLDDALGRLARGDWRERALPALTVGAQGWEDFVAYNDIVVVRRGEGQIKVTARVNGALYTRLAGDGAIVSTPSGSAAYTIAAGGPLLTSELNAFALTALPTHGGFSPPLVISADAVLELDVATGHGGGRLEVDGRRQGPGVPTALRISLVPDAASVVAFDGQESQLTGLRRRGILSDSPRIIADDKRAGTAASE